MPGAKHVFPFELRKFTLAAGKWHFFVPFCWSPLWMQVCVYVLSLTMRRKKNHPNNPFSVWLWITDIAAVRKQQLQTWDMMTLVVLSALLGCWTCAYVCVCASVCVCALPLLNHSVGRIALCIHFLLSCTVVLTRSTGGDVHVSPIHCGLPWPELSSVPQAVSRDYRTFFWAQDSSERQDRMLLKQWIFPLKKQSLDNFLTCFSFSSGLFLHNRSPWNTCSVYFNNLMTHETTGCNYLKVRVEWNELFLGKAWQVAVSAVKAVRGFPVCLNLLNSDRRAVY